MKKMKYKPFRDLVLVKKIEEAETVSGIVLPDTRRMRFITLEVIEIGESVKLPLLPGDIVRAESMYEKLDDTQGLILEQYIVAKEENDVN